MNIVERNDQKAEKLERNSRNANKNECLYIINLIFLHVYLVLLLLGVMYLFHYKRDNSEIKSRTVLNITVL